MDMKQRLTKKVCVAYLDGVIIFQGTIIVHFQNVTCQKKNWQFFQGFARIIFKLRRNTPFPWTARHQNPLKNSQMLYPINKY